MELALMRMKKMDVKIKRSSGVGKQTLLNQTWIPYFVRCLRPHKTVVGIYRLSAYTLILVI